MLKRNLLTVLACLLA